MKWLVIALAVASIAAVAWWVPIHVEHTSPTIFVNFGDINDAWGGGQGLPAVEGFAQPEPGSSQPEDAGRPILTALEWYKVSKFPGGKLVVLAHYQITRDGNVENIDRALSIWDHKPASADWVKVDDVTHACAYYMPGSTMSY